MTRLLKFIFFIICTVFIQIVFPTISHSQHNKTDTIKILLIGNSFSQNASRFLSQIAEENHIYIKLGHAELGGCPLQKHWELAALNAKGDQKGKAYKGKSLQDLLSEDKWDFVTLQQASILSGDSASYHPYVENLHSLIKKISPNAKVFIHQTWPYRIDAPSFTHSTDSTSAKSAYQMWYLSRKNYHHVSKQLHLPIIPVGDGFQLAQENYRTTYYPDYNFDSTIQKYPILPNQEHSLHMGYYYKNYKLIFDTHHANDNGCYLAGLIWAAQLLHIDPMKVNYKPTSTSQSFAEDLRHIAHFFYQ